MARERILITVKTYPTLSRKYGETVCTAGVREDGTWVRIYPVPFRRLEEAEQYKKYDWIECDLIPSRKDIRPETHHPADVKSLVPAGHMDTSDKWRERRRLLLGKCHVFRNLAEVIAAAKANNMSLSLFKPARVVDFVWEAEEREWDPGKVEEMRQLASQGELFEEEQWRRNFRVIPNLPYSFSYRFEDETGKPSELQVLDWEVGALFWKCLGRADGDEAVALEKVKQKYFNDFLATDLHFYLGTTQQWHAVAPNPWVIIGVLPIPHEIQPQLF
ncbi:hypothetical protein OKA05_28530 [Luteolibacter arcticus]|uniref:Uncharacterized protein n=1 Tax=Luteolibacter arcticus TaxID=1581411 RepID=A0ABT3GSM5_9BACT|nr:hypothetical protein [Luteolibacter arcticus]MCW1926532.1 hypothetical protein [Luteolibacter arcticus]